MNNLLQPDEIETWLPVGGYEGLYEVSSFGNVRSITRNVKSKNGYRTLEGQQIVKTLDQFGYMIVAIWKNGDSKNRKVARLVCAAFHPNLENKSQVNHKDTDKTNDYYKNLEWNTNKENQDHAVDNGLRSECIAVAVTKHGELFGNYLSLKRAAGAVSHSVSMVHRLLNTGKKSRSGFQFKTLQSITPHLLK